MRHIKSVTYNDDMCRVVLDGFEVLELDTLTVSQSGIDEDIDIDDELLEKLVLESQCIKARKTAAKYVDLRMRTEKQVLKYLSEKGFAEDVALQTVSDMKQWGYIDDHAYSRTYIEYRLRGSKKSWRAIFYDLCMAGIESDIINDVKDEYDTDEYARAQEVAQNILRGKTDETSLKRLKGVLERNGFYWDVISSVISSVTSDEEDY